MEPHQPSPITENPQEQQPSKRKLFMIIAVIVLILLGAALFLLQHNRTSSTKKTLKNTELSATYQDRYSPNEPTSKIMIAGHQYRSACRLLPPKNIADIYGPFERTAKFTETFAETESQVTLGDVLFAKPSCMYSLKDPKETSVHVSIDYYESADTAVKMLARNSLLSDAQANYGAATERLRQAIEAKEITESQAAGSIKLLSSLTTSAEYLQSLNQRGVPSKTNPSTPPSNPVVAFNTIGTIFSVQLESAVVSFSSRQLLGESSQKKITERSAQELIQIFSKADKALTVIQRNYKDKSLPQGPISATFPDTPGRKVYEPCKVLDTTVLSSVVKAEVKRPVEQTSTIYDRKAVLVVKSMGKEHSAPAYTECEKKYGSSQDKSTPFGLANIRISYPADAAATKVMMDDLRSGYTYTQNVSVKNADEAFFTYPQQGPASGSLDQPTSIFVRKGITIFTIRVQRLDADAGPLDSSSLRPPSDYQTLAERVTTKL